MSGEGTGEREGGLTTCLETLSTPALLVASRSWKVLRIETGIEGISSSIWEICCQRLQEETWSQRRRKQSLRCK